MRVGSRGRRRRRHRTLHDIYEQRCTDNNKMEKPICTEIGEDDIMTTTSASRNNSNLKRYWTVIASSALFAFMIPVTCGAMLPAWETQPSSAGMGRNIRHLPCVSRRTGETGLCMFAYSCAKANGTHLGTCIDRFYFGSCCRIASGTDIDTIEPIVHNNLSNKEDVAVSTVKSTYQRPSSYSDYSAETPGPSTVSMPVSMSTMSRPLSVVSIPSSTTGDLYSSTYQKVSSSSRPSLVTANKGSFDSSSATSRTPTFNVTFSQTYSSPTAHVTTSPLVYSTTVTTTFQTGTHKPLPVGSTTAYSKPITKPALSASSSKPISGKPTKPTTGKPGSPPKTKPKPTVKPVVTGTPTYPAVYTSTSPTISSLINKTTLHAAFTNNGLSSKPSSLVTEPSVPIKPYPSSNPGIPTPINQFTTSSKKPTKPTFRPTTSTSPPSSSNYVKIPVSTVSSPNKPTTVSSLSSHIQTIHTIYTTPTTPTYPTTVAVSADTSTFLKFNSSISENEITERPLSSFWTTTLASEKPPSRPWSSSSSSATTSQPSLVTWTTIEEVPAVILPDRSKPTTIPKPTGKPGTKPSFLPTYTKPSSTGKPTKPTKPVTTKPEYEVDYRPTITMIPSSSSVSTTATSPSWVEVSVTTHAPSSQAAISSEFTSISTTGIITTQTQTSSKPSTSITIPVVSPLPIETTPSSSIETNEIESPALNMSDYKEVCGRRLFPTARIVGGEKASFGKWPWQISLRQWRTSTYLHKCGAALFNENWAVTAAHCVENVPPGDLLLRLGEFDLQSEEEPYGYQERRVQIVASHPQFDPRTFEYDLALLRFYEPVQFQPNIIPICVPEDDTNFVGSSAYVTGWGRLYEGSGMNSFKCSVEKTSSARDRMLELASSCKVQSLNIDCDTPDLFGEFVDNVPLLMVCPSPLIDFGTYVEMLKKDYVFPVVRRDMSYSVEICSNPGASSDASSSAVPPNVNIFAPVNSIRRPVAHRLQANDNQSFNPGFDIYNDIPNLQTNEVLDFQPARSPSVTSSRLSDYEDYNVLESNPGYVLNPAAPPFDPLNQEVPHFDPLNPEAPPFDPNNFPLQTEAGIVERQYSYPPRYYPTPPDDVDPSVQSQSVVRHVSYMPPQIPFPEPIPPVIPDLVNETTPILINLPIVYIIPVIPLSIQPLFLAPIQPSTFNYLPAPLAFNCVLRTPFPRFIYSVEPCQNLGCPFSYRCPTPQIEQPQPEQHRQTTACQFRRSGRFNYQCCNRIEDGDDEDDTPRRNNEAPPPKRRLSDKFDAPGQSSTSSEEPTSDSDYGTANSAASVEEMTTRLDNVTLNGDTVRTMSQIKVQISSRDENCRKRKYFTRTTHSVEYRRNRQSGLMTRRFQNPKNMCFVRPSRDVESESMENIKSAMMRELNLDRRVNVADRLISREFRNVQRSAARSLCSPAVHRPYHLSNLNRNGPLPSVLQEVTVPVINNSVCESMYQSAGYIEHIPNIFICAGWRKGGFDSCEGDSGGPMVIQRPDKRWILAGVISWGIGCAEPNQPGVYTRISAFRDWINQILQF